MKTLILIMILACSLSNGQEITLTLQESLELGLKNSKELNIANSNILKADAGVSEISSMMLPKLSLNASYAKMSDVPPFQVSFPSLPNPITIQESILNNYNVNAKIEQTLFTGFKLSALKSAAELYRNAENINYEKETLNKLDEIQKAFWNYYSSLQLVTLIDENLMALNSHLKNTNTFLENGLATKNDLLKIKVEVSSTELKLLEANNNSKKARALLNKALGLPLENETIIKVEELICKPFENEYDQLLTQARENRQEIRTSKLQIEALKERNSC